MILESLLSKYRRDYLPKLSPVFKDFLLLEVKKEKFEVNIDEKLKKIFPRITSQSFVSFFKQTKTESGNNKKAPIKIGVVFSGGQAPGGHNVIAGIFDAMKLLNPQSILYGFINGPSGIIEGKYEEITSKLLAPYRNGGGFDLIGSGRTKIETDDQMQASKNTVEKLDLDGLVIIGGDDSNTNAALLSEYFLKKGCKTAVVGVPKTIDGDLKNKYILTSFGFDTATKVYSELIGNIARDALSAKKYYHFVKLMGRSASHVTLECMLQTKVNFAFIAEETEKEKKTIKQLTTELADLICKRAAMGKNYGVVLIPEGLIEFIPEMKNLIKQLNLLLANKPEVIEKFNLLSEEKERIALIDSYLEPDLKKTFAFLPDKIKLQLLLERDPHGNVQVSLIETERLFMEMVKEELKKRKDFKGKFNALAHFLGYEGRSSFPSNFDADYCYNLGFVAVALLKEKLTGYICCVSDLFLTFDHWKPMGIPLVSLMNIEIRKGEEKPVIKKALVDLNGKAYKYFEANRDKWGIGDEYLYPGPIQYFGEKELTDRIARILEIES